MLHIKNLDEGLPVFKALASEIRIRIVKLLLDNGEMNMNELAADTGTRSCAVCVRRRSWWTWFPN